MKIKALTISLVFALTAAALAQEGPVPKGVHPLDHVFVVVMENHGFNEILNNPNAPFINQYAQQASLATNYLRSPIPASLITSRSSVARISEC